jgi:hypothetical protein
LAAHKRAMARSRMAAYFMGRFFDAKRADQNGRPSCRKGKGDGDLNY